MKITNFTTSIKRNAFRVLAAATLTCAFLAAAAPAAQAQRIVVGVGFGHPRYFAPAPPPVRFYGGPVYAYGYHPDWRYHHDFYRRGWR